MKIEEYAWTPHYRITRRYLDGSTSRSSTEDVMGIPNPISLFKGRVDYFTQDEILQGVNSGMVKYTFLGNRWWYNNAPFLGDVQKLIP